MLPVRATTLLTSQLASVSAFLLGALTLLLPSGYAYGAAVFIVFAMASFPLWAKERLSDRSAVWLALVFAVMGAVWIFGADLDRGLSALNKPFRYVLALACIPVAFLYPPKGRWLLWGIAVGAAFGGLRASYDIFVLGYERAWYDAAHQSSSGVIQYGNMSGLFGLICWVQWAVFHERWSWRRSALMLACVFLGVLGSLLSQTRGGWVALVLCMVPLLWLIYRYVANHRFIYAVLGLLAVVMALLWHQSSYLQERWSLARDEVAGFVKNGEADNSVGHRLAHWKLAWDMGLEKPLTGWGEAGYAEQKRLRVEKGEAPPSVMYYGHAHNEWFDMFVKRGVIGLVGLLLFYAVPLALFWPTQARVQRPDRTIDPEALCLRLAGMLFPLAYLGFGLTQVYLAHFNGNMIYLFMVLFFMAAIRGHQRGHGGSV